MLKPTLVLLPAKIADRCYLIEALYWIAFRRLPIEELTESGLDRREDTEYVEGLEPGLPWDLSLSDVETSGAGLGRDPSYEAFLEDKFYSSPAEIRRLLRLDLQPQDRERLEGELEESISFHQRQAAFQEELDAYLDVYRSKLFIELREGGLKAFGRQLPKNTIEASITELEGDWEWSSKSELQAIPSGFWESRGIDWTQCAAEGRNIAFAHILLDWESLVTAFPIPAGDAIAQGVAKVGNAYVIQDQAEVAQSTSARRGRPPYDWESFHVEMARRIRAGGVPKKREALIAELQVWCKDKWGRDVGRSTILQKLKPYGALLG